jgi:zinc transport system substrate-binding protein
LYDKKVISLNRNDYYLEDGGLIHLKKRKVYIISLLVLVLFALTACNKTEEKQIDQISIYTTVYPLQYFAERIGGDAVSVQSIYPPGADEHTFDPTQKDMIGLADADLFFYIGLGLEGFVENAEKTMQNEHVKMVATADAITEEMLGHEDEDIHEDEDHHHGDLDPHVWMSPVLSDALAYSIKESLIEIAPDKKAAFEKNFEELQNDLLKLDRQFIEMASNAPTKTFFVSHAAFGYIADTYGLEQTAIAGLNSQSEPSQKQLTSLVEEAKKHDVKYILFEQNVSSKLTDVVRKEIGAESLMLHNLGVLTTEDIKNNEDYFSLMEYNIQTLEKALSGK